MVKFYSSSETYPYPFPAVTLAYFLRYPNPYSTHVVSTDTIARHYDPELQRLTTIRLHLKRSKLPAAVLKLLPRSVLGASAGGDTQTYILEKSVVDIKEGWMKTQSRNLNFTGVLSVVEQQHYSINPPDSAQALPQDESSISTLSPTAARPISPNTFVTTTFSYRSSLGNRKAERAAAATEDATPKRFGTWISGWGAKRIQSSIESIASNKTDDQMTKSRDGMRLVLERLRSNGVVATLRELRRSQGKTVFEP